MKIILATTLILTSLSSFASAKIKFPAKSGEGFININERKEYNYHGYKNEEIWHEFGRPYWRTKEVVTQETREVITQETKETRSSTMRDISENYDPVKKTLTLDVKFKLNKADIQRSYTTAIDKLGMALKEDKNLKIEIQGHTDTTGSRAYNNALSSNRAQSVKKYLMDNFAVPSSQLVSKGYGPSQPIKSNDSREGREENRRVDIKILD